jgi:hypothetical protein
MEIFSIFTYWKGSWVFTRAWHIYLFFVFNLDLSWKGIRDFRAFVRHFIVTRSRVFIVYGTYKRPSNHHFLSALSKCKAFVRAGVKTIRTMVRIRWRTMRQLPGEVIFWSIAKACSSSRQSIF